MRWDILLEIQGKKMVVKINKRKATLLLRSGRILGTSQASTQMSQRVKYVSAPTEPSSLKKLGMRENIKLMMIM